MPNVLINDATMSAIGTSIRGKTGGSALLLPSAMPAAIDSISTGGPEPVTGFIETAWDSEGFPTKGYLKNMTVIPNGRFANRAVNNGPYTRLTEIAGLDLVTSVGEYSFSNTGPIEEVVFSELTSVAAFCFNQFRAETIRCPLLTSLPSYFAYQANGVKCADFSALTWMGQNVFYQTGMLALIIRTPSVASMTHINALQGTPIASGTGYVYVPRTLVDSYKAATNWTTYAAQIRAIEDYEEITGG